MTWINVSGLKRVSISPKIAQTLVLHSDIRLTMNVYLPPEYGPAARCLPIFSMAPSW